MLRTCFLIALFLASNLVALSQTTAPDAGELTKLLNDFLAGASRGDAAIHDRFWADDLIYTRSAGRRLTKAEVMRDVRSAPAPKPDDPKTTYSAEDIKIQQYGDTAIVAFRLVSKTEGYGATRIANLLNSGTFLKRNGKWQVVNWQSTRMARSEDDAKREVIQAYEAFFQTLFAADARKFEELTDESFTWVSPLGMEESKKVIVDRLVSGEMKYSKREIPILRVTVSGDTAIVRGGSAQRMSITGVPDLRSDAYGTLYTLVFANQGGTWRVIAMNTTGI